MVKKKTTDVPKSVDGLVTELIVPNNTDPETVDDLMREALKNAVTACEKTFDIHGDNISYGLRFEVRQVYLNNSLGPGHIYDSLEGYKQSKRK